MAEVVDEVPGHRAHRIGAQSAVVVRGAEKEVDARVPVVGFRLLPVLDQPGDLALDDDREACDVLLLAARLLADVLHGQPRPPACDLRIGAQLDDPVDVLLSERPQDDAISTQLHDGPVTHPATTLRP